MTTHTDTPLDIDWDVIEAKRAKAANQSIDITGSHLLLRRHMHVAKENGVDVGNGEYLYAHVTLYSSKRGVIRPNDPDHKKKLEQWKQADAAKEDL